MVRRKPRGQDNSIGQADLSLEEKRAQWNINLANRVLENMFGEYDLENSEVVTSKFVKYRQYSAQQLFDKARDYFRNIQETNEGGISVIPDIEDFCLFVQISRDTFQAYRSSEDPDMRNVAQNIANAIAACKKQSALQGTLNPTIFAIDMNNNHGYVQSKSEITVNQNVTMQQLESNIVDIANRLPVEDEDELEIEENDEELEIEENDEK